jgi:biopolymer transport protein TolR
MDIYPEMKVFVRGDQNVPYGRVVSLMSFLQKNGVNKVGIVTESPDAK